MSYGGRFTNVGKGTLKRVDQKRSEKSPDFKGGATVEGKEYWLSCWEREDGSMSLSFEPKLARDHQGAPANPPAQRQGSTTTGSRFNQPAPAGDPPPFDDDIPF